MTRIDFYVLEPGHSGNRFTLACRLVEKILQQPRRIYLHTAGEAEARALDRLLWTFRDGSFLPHGLAGQVAAELNPILVGWGEDPGAESDVLINLGDQVPQFFSRFDRVAECIDQDPRGRAAGRERFRFYRDRGYPLQTHKVGG
jgi:DNA polymerase III subunit chi